MLAKFDESAKRKGLLQPRVLGGLATVAEARRDWAAAQKQLGSVVERRATEVPRPCSGWLTACSSRKIRKLPWKNSSRPRRSIPRCWSRRPFWPAFANRLAIKENAKKWIDAALKAAPQDLKTNLFAGQWALETEQFPEARTYAAAAMQIDPKSLDAKILSGLIALFQRDYRAAENYFQAATTQSPRSFAASNNLALALLEQADESKKQRALDYALSNYQQYPKVAEAASTYGWVLYRLGKIDEAEKVFRAMASAGGGFSPDTAYYIARLSVDRGREQDAQQWLQSALKSTGPFLMRSEAKALLKQLTRSDAMWGKSFSYSEDLNTLLESEPPPVFPRPLQPTLSLGC